MAPHRQHAADSAWPAVTAGVSKAAKKNAARRAKKAGPGAGLQGGSQSCPSAAGTPAAPPASEPHGEHVESLAAGLEQVSINGDVGAPGPAEGDQTAAAHKRIRALKKKIRLCEEQAAKAAERGEPPSEETRCKLLAIPEWCGFDEAAAVLPALTVLSREERSVSDGIVLGDCTRVMRACA